MFPVRQTLIVYACSTGLGVTDLERAKVPRRRNPAIGAMGTTYIPNINNGNLVGAEWWN